MITVAGRILVALAAAATLSVASAGGIEVVNFADAEQESRYMDLINQLRCLVCQNQTIAESNAELASDMRDVVKEQVLAGQSDDQIIGFLTERYGDFVRYRPPIVARTAALWFAPFVVAIIAFLLLPRLANRRRRVAIPASEQDNAKRLLSE
ncbi:MAG: cytochrome c-type biogenesis protein CcmH [Betaproteobacteria bacterium]|nr:cytochrome c-type biogenesis protein CcmH [Betaproteobacteria bacterium]